MKNHNTTTNKDNQQQEDEYLSSSPQSSSQQHRKRKRQNHFQFFLNFLTRLSKQNNRSLATLFGCIGGFVLGVILAIKEEQTFPLVGRLYPVIGIFLSAGTCGNLSSYIGGSIDIVTGDKTVVDLFRYLYTKWKSSNDRKNVKYHDTSNNNNNNNNNNNSRQIEIPLNTINDTTSG